jgi:hypothetical protein
MKKATILFLLIAGFIQIQFYSFGQETSGKQTNLNFFLDCWDCDFNFVRQELEFVSFVRDPKLADVHILSSSQRTGSGGERFFLNFIGLNTFKGQDYEYEYMADQADTPDEIRQGLLKVIKLGILQYYSKTDFFGRINIDLEDTEEMTASEIVADPWNKWVFSLEAGSDLRKEESQDEFSLGTELRIQKVTEEWKARMEGEYNLNKENYYDDGEKIENRQTNSEISANYIKSLSPKWSAGVFGEYNSSTYLNTKHAYRFDAGIEYNIFPWDISNRKVFVFRYLAGISNHDYMEVTVYDKLSETLYYEALQLDLEIIQPWGRVETRLEWRHYFHDFSKSRLILDSQISIRLTRNLSVFSEVEYQLIHDQLYLPKGNASLEDVLLRRRKMATNYELGFEFGFQFTFGSIYNNIVNERF